MVLITKASAIKILIYETPKNTTQNGTNHALHHFTPAGCRPKGPPKLFRI